MGATSPGRWTANGLLDHQRHGEMENCQSSGSQPWYHNRSKITKTVITGGVTSIGANVFRGCTGLTSVTIPDSVTSIGKSAFYNRTGLKEVIYNAKAITDGSYAFRSRHRCGRNEGCVWQKRGEDPQQHFLQLRKA